ncbi:hypothetical protein [Nitrospirillum sp. BR 11163]|uniref:hypothetical protein n=1 Tax=Nitrospirillum sp. BR 11163 TaxID=3104323 RepID=UPI002AFE6F7E|nr:hypothetical protein [Nitrospirillum sp. BR 11163]MEA1672489.1 hypothetical protein [Nitrospirillum sp. BR 11163]
MGKTLIHYHLFKNAGSSIDKILRKYFEDQWASFDGDDPYGLIDDQQIREYFECHEYVIALSSHLARPPIPYADTIPIVFLRHPVDRALSVYRFWQANPHLPGHQFVVNRTFRDFIDWSIKSNDVGSIIKNYHVIHLTGAAFRYRTDGYYAPNIQDLNDLKALLENWSTFGIVRRFDKSMALFNAAYGSLFPGLFEGSCHENITNAAFVSDEMEVERARDLAGADIIADFIDSNYLDMELYSWAQQIFDRKLHVAVAAA